MKIFHFVPDDKFIDSTIRRFDAEPRAESVYYCVRRESYGDDYQYIKNKNLVRSITKRELAAVLKESRPGDVMILHSIHPWFVEKIRSIPSYLTLVWFPWGFDLYNDPSPLVKLPLYRSETRRIVRPTFRQHWRSVVRAIRRFLKGTPPWQRRRAISRIDYCATVLPEEFDLLKASVSFFRAKQVFFNYESGDGDLLTPTPYEIVRSRKNILIGNSATPTGNHLDVFAKLRPLNLDGIRLYATLSYGDPKYALKIKNEAARQFGERFCAIDRFMPFDEYYRLIQSCGCVVCYHERQQAIGNITLALQSGVKVFLSKTSIQYRHFKNRGFHLFSVEDDLTQNRIETPLEPNEVVENFELLYHLAATRKNDFDQLIQTLLSVRRAAN